MDWLLTASEARFGQLTVEVMTPLDTRWRTLHLLETSSLTRLGFKQRAWALLKQYLPLCSS